MRDALSQAFEHAAKYSIEFEKYRAVYLENIATNVRKQYYGSSIEILHEIVNKLEGHIKLVDSMPLLKDVGIIQVDSRALKNPFSEAPKKSLTAMQVSA